MNRYDQAWQRLATAARHSPEEEIPGAPFGFATRVAALGLANAPAPTAAALLEKFALRGFVVAAAFSLAAAAFGFTAISVDQDDELADTVTEVLAQS